MSDQFRKNFLRDVAHHEMRILRDDGVCRHIRFAQPGTCNRQFDLVTWPWRLCYTGDMGDFVFSRLEDMFEFFRAPDHLKKDGLYINSGYWAEKVLAVDRSDGMKAYSEELFEKIIRETLDDYEVSKEVRKAVEEEILERDCSSESDARALVENFNDCHEEFQFHDFWEHDLEDYTHRFLWCCYALSWGIGKYDALKLEVSA